jgi:hypothetical protein
MAGFILNEMEPASCSPCESKKNLNHSLVKKDLDRLNRNLTLARYQLS